MFAQQQRNASRRVASLRDALSLTSNPTQNFHSRDVSHSASVLRSRETLHSPYDPLASRSTLSESRLSLVSARSEPPTTAVSFKDHTIGSQTFPQPLACLAEDTALISMTSDISAATTSVLELAASNTGLLRADSDSLCALTKSLCDSLALLISERKHQLEMYQELRELIVGRHRTQRRSSRKRKDSSYAHKKSLCNASQVHSLAPASCVAGPATPHFGTSLRLMAASMIHTNPAPSACSSVPEARPRRSLLDIAKSARLSDDDCLFSFA